MNVSISIIGVFSLKCQGRIPRNSNKSFCLCSVSLLVSFENLASEGPGFIRLGFAGMVKFSCRNISVTFMLAF